MTTAEPTRSRSSDSIAGYLAAMSIFICLIGLAWHPLRLILPGILVAMVAAGMGGRHQRLAFAAVLVARYFRKGGGVPMLRMMNKPMGEPHGPGVRPRRGAW